MAKFSENSPNSTKKVAVSPSYLPIDQMVILADAPVGVFTNRIKVMVTLLKLVNDN